MGLVWREKGAKMKVVLVRLGARVERAARNSHTLAIAEKLRMDVYYISAKFQVQQGESWVAGAPAVRTAHSGMKGGGGKKHEKLRGSKEERQDATTMG